MSRTQHGLCGFCLVAALVMVLSGCGGGPNLGYVTGKVTMNGQPVANAEVEFQPVDNQRASTGATNAEGVYELNFTAHKKGVLVGEHIVRISAGERDGDDEDARAKPATIPEKYNSKSELKRTVKSGSQEFDFEL